MAYSINARVFAYWEDDEYYYPATVTKIENDDIYIRYDDGGEEWTTSDYLADLAVAVGDEIESMWSEDEEYYAAEVTEVRGEQVRITWDDDESEEWTTMSTLRTWDDE
ncbi:MAG: hypothetical protein KF832_25380 [Caldilineaceae bacterium]|nr:hypothetical protein [Caldilineaceae bacterium]